MVGNPMWKIKMKVIVDLSYDGGKEDPIDLDRQDQGEVEEQGGGIPQKHLQIFDVHTVQCSL